MYLWYFSLQTGAEGYLSVSKNIDLFDFVSVIALNRIECNMTCIL